MTTTFQSMREWQRENNRIGKRAVRGGTVPRSIPEGRVLHHNHVQHGPDTICGANGFRAWTCTEVLDGFVKCPCTWSGLAHVALKKHVKIYRKDGRLKSTGEFGKLWSPSREMGRLFA